MKVDDGDNDDDVFSLQMSAIVTRQTLLTHTDSVSGK